MLASPTPPTTSSLLVFLRSAMLAKHLTCQLRYGPRLGSWYVVISCEVLHLRSNLGSRFIPERHLKLLFSSVASSKRFSSHFYTQTLVSSCMRSIRPFWREKVSQVFYSTRRSLWFDLTNGLNRISNTNCPWTNDTPPQPQKCSRKCRNYVLLSVLSRGETIYRALTYIC